MRAVGIVTSHKRTNRQKKKPDDIAKSRVLSKTGFKFISSSIKNLLSIYFFSNIEDINDCVCLIHKCNRL